MKKAFQTALLTLIAVALFVVTANAESKNPNFENIVESPAAVFNYQGSADNIIKTSITDVFQTLKSNDNFHLTLSDLKTADLLNDVLLSNNITVVIADPQYNGLTYLLLETSDSEFNRIIDTITEFEGLEETKYDGHTIYSSYKRNTFALVQYNGSTILAESLTDAKQILDRLESNTFDISKYENKFQNDYFLSGIVFEELTNNDYSLDLPSSDIIFSVSQPSRNTFQIESYSSISENEYKKFGIDISNSTFTPELYKVVPAKNPTFYLEFNDLTSTFTGILNSAVSSDPYLGTEFDSIIDNSLLEIFDGKTAFLLEFRSNNIIPLATLITENSSNQLTDAANREVFSILEDVIYTEINQDIREFNVFQYDLNKNAYQVYFEEASDFSLHFGQVNEYYVVSTNPNIKSELGSNTLASNSGFTSTLNDALNSNNTTSLAYINPSNSADYISYIYKKFENDFYGNEKEQFNLVLNVLENLDATYSYSTYDNGEAYNYTQISAPISDLINSSLNTALTLTSYSNYFYNRLTDVDDSKWYAEDLKVAVRNGVIKGKEGPNYTYYFDASGTTTRAEFVTMLLRHYGLEWETTVNGSSIFTDVTSDAWYNNNIGIAYSVGIISETGGAFRPKENITRAEAIQMIKNYSGVLYKVDANQNPFKDVKNSDSFADAVKAAYAQGIITGTTPNTFEPYKTLNRAEAVAILNRVAEREFSFLQ